MFYDVWELGLLRNQTFNYVSLCGARSCGAQASPKLSVAEDDLQLVPLPLLPAQGLGCPVGTSCLAYILSIFKAFFLMLLEV